jgi:hypothetical protein
MKPAILAVLVVPALAMPAAASASWTLTQRAAQADARQVAHKEYGHNRYKVHAACWPKGQVDPFIAGRRNFPGYYHAWQCSWVRPYSDGSTCSGGVAIKGTHATDFDFFYTVIIGERCK